MGKVFQSINPATDINNPEVLWRGEAASSDEVNEAVNKARAAFEHWSGLSFEDRKKYLEKFIEELKANWAHIQTTISKETGKPLWESGMELLGMVNKLTVATGAYEERTGTRSSPTPSIIAPNAVSITRHKPHGVVAVFGPYNFPGHVPNGHIIPALLAGNTIVYKPSELTPLVAEEIMKLWQRVDLPPGVLNLLQGGTDTGIALSKHPQIDGLFFTGSSRTGLILHQQFAAHPEKILALEMGGNNPLVVFDVENLVAASYLTIQSAFITSGQRCTCARRLIIEEGKQGDKFIEVLVEMTKNIKIGHYDENDIFMGPVITHQQAKNVLNEQNRLLEQGAKPLLEMTMLKPGTGFISPGIIGKMNKSCDKEIFGPLLRVFRVKSFDEAVAEANNTAYGLSAGLISDSKELYSKFYKKVRAGIINWNSQITGANSTAPFGGTGISGNHRPSGYYAADYCAYPVASLESSVLQMPKELAPGVSIGANVK